MNIYNSGYEEVWQRFALDMGASYVRGQFGASDQVLATEGPWEIQYDTHTARAISGTLTYERSYTRVKALFNSPDHLKFRIERKGGLGRIANLLSIGRGIQTGIPSFDSQFNLTGSDPAKLRSLFCDPEIRSLLEQLEDEKIEVLMGEGPWQEPFPAGASVLYFSTDEVIVDVGWLKNLHSLFAELLNGLAALGSAAPFVVE